MKSKITGGETVLLFAAKILNKYEVKYYQCIETGFIQTEEPYWLQEAYSSAITKLDIGLPYRNELLRDKTVKILMDNFNVHGRFLDYAGGYGLFTRLMRDKGFNFYHTDIYCQNLFAENFDLADIKEQSPKFEVLTAFEVFEHMVNPKDEISRLFSYSDNVLFSTELQPETTVKGINHWWYLSPETGQHISFFNRNSLEFLSKKFGYNFYSDGVSTHLFSKRKFAVNPFKEKRAPFFIRKMRRMVHNYELKKYPPLEGLLQSDWQYIKDKINQH
ncbi:class I SAM-dependent methyltransferase (plasmid) [Pedobacter sp. BS3]|uniref:class I SAM-dependent methyltransferase n=1 Tax=Pedobacter sp. BS3 TaxID=2567937 RepID=UPI0011EFC196|nr:class I SAM-dependent methyltransferase [Pedobacter sp. BS3]TZF86010.1 class I SAM-dependent methyltransferase [Pedobacter sp. BS3]